MEKFTPKDPIDYEKEVEAMEKWRHEEQNPYVKVEELREKLNDWRLRLVEIGEKMLSHISEMREQLEKLREILQTRL